MQATFVSGQIVHDPTLFANLTALAESAFPKCCNSCGRIYPDAKSFIEQTDAIRGHSGLKASEGDDGEEIVELFRNCICGSTLLDFFNDRRDLSEQGRLRRERFGDSLAYLVSKGVPRLEAREALLKLLHGQSSNLFRDL